MFKSLSIISLASLFLLGAGTASAQVATSTATTSAPVIAKISPSPVVPNAWVVVSGAGLFQTQLFVDDKKVPLANLIFSDSSGKVIKYRVQDMLGVNHTMYALDPVSKQKSNTLAFVVNQSNITPSVPSSAPVVKNVVVQSLGGGSVWQIGTEKKVSWQAAGTGELDILICSGVPTVCTQLISKTSNDGFEFLKLNTNIKIGKSYIVVRKYKDDLVKAQSLEFTVTSPSAFYRTKLQLASVLEGFQSLLLKLNF